MNDDSRLPRFQAISEDLQAISDLHAQHYRKGTRVQRLLDVAVARLGNPALLAFLTGGIAIWIATNLATQWFGLEPIDPPPFELLQGIASVTAVFMTALILTTQRREDELSRHRDQLTLEFVILGERKSAKIIELLEEMRRDNPMVVNRIDDAAAAMAKSVDAGAVLNAIEEVQRTVDEERR